MSAPKDAQQALVDIERAQTWALKHFNVGAQGGGLLDKPTFEIDFEGDRMTVYPRSYGQRLPGIHYRLTWVGDQIEWEGYGVLSRNPICWLKVQEKQDD